MPELQKNWLIPEETHKAIVEGIVNHLGFDRALSYELDDEGKLHARYGRGIDPRDSSYSDGRVPDPGEIFDWAIKEKKEQIVLDPANDPRCNPQKVKRDNTKPFAVVPIEKDGKVKFVVTVNNWETKQVIEQTRLDIAKIISGTTFDITGNKKLSAGLSGSIIDQIQKFFCVDVYNYIKTLQDLELKFQNEGIDKEVGVKALNTASNYITKKGDELEKAINNNKLNKEIKIFFRNLLHYWITKGAIITRALEKPRGFAGDYKTVEIIYDNKPISGGFGYLSDLCFLNSPLAVGVRNRKDIMKKILQDISSKSKYEVMKILNLASGSCREIREVLPLLPEQSKLCFTCVDFDEEALSFSQKTLLVEEQNKVEIKFVKSNIVLDILRGHRNKNISDKYDMIYSIGLADYLPDKVLGDLIIFCYNHSAPNGKLIISHKDHTKYQPLFEDWFCNWRFYSRDEDQLISLIRDLNIGNIAIQSIKDKSQIIFFIIIEKL